MFDFSRITLFSLGYCILKYKLSIYAKNFGGHSPLSPPGYTYACVFDGAIVNDF